MNRLCMPAVFAMAAVLQAQAPDVMVQDLQRSWQGIKNNIQAAADAMPEDGYAFKPTPDIRAFGGWVGHAADAQMGFCSGIGGQRQDLKAEAMTSKAELLAALKKSFDACDAVYMGTTAANHDEAVMPPFGGPTTRAAMLYGNIAHSQECYGSMAVYLRLKSIVPPSTARRGQGKKKG